MEDEFFMDTTHHESLGHTTRACTVLKSRAGGKFTWTEWDPDTWAWGTGRPGRFWGIWPTRPVACLGSECSSLGGGEGRGGEGGGVVLGVVVRELGANQQAPGNWGSITTHQGSKKQHNKAYKVVLGNVGFLYNEWGRTVVAFSIGCLDVIDRNHLACKILQGYEW